VSEPDIALLLRQQEQMLAGFADFRAQLTALTERFGAVEARIGGIEARIIENRLTALEKRLDMLIERAGTQESNTARALLLLERLAP
jgi:hypothetical protein